MSALLILLMALVGGGQVAIRAGMGVGWGGEPIVRDGKTLIGVAFNDYDNLSYVAWAQQARVGAFPFSDLHTTEPHRALLINPFFMAVGAAARLSGAEPMLIFNLCGWAAAVALVPLLYRAGRAMGLSARGALLAAALAALGSGLSWVSIGLRLAFRFPAALGADFAGVGGYYDLFPATAAALYPYQSVGFALLAALLWCVAEAERGLAAGAGVKGWLIATGVAGAALASVRPYEPAAFLICYAGAAVMSWVAGGANKAGKGNSDYDYDYDYELRARGGRVKVLVILAMAMGPFLLYALWMARQPVWDHFARASLAKPCGRAYWLVGFGLFWPLAAAGWGFARRTPAVRLHLAGVWAAFLFVLLVGLDSAQTKLAAGGFLALSLLAGHAWDRIFNWIGGMKNVRRAGWTALAGGGLLAMGATLFIVFPYLAQEPPAVSGDLIAMTRVIRKNATHPIPAVLTNTACGWMLPGLAGCRVYAGHAALTPGREKKLAELAAAGLEPADAPPASPTPAALERLLTGEQFDFVLAPRACPAAAWLRANPRLRLLKALPSLLLFAAAPAQRKD